MIDLQTYQNRITNLCETAQVKELALFGSATRDDFNKDSDIDVLVVFEGKEHLFDRYFDLKEGLENIFNRSVDVVMIEAIKNPIFKKSIEKEKTLVYAA
jgi:predicted nucleotidyltransferase